MTIGGKRTERRKQFCGRKVKPMAMDVLGSSIKSVGEATKMGDTYTPGSSVSSATDQPETTGSAAAAAARKSASKPAESGLKKAGSTLQAAGSKMGGGLTPSDFVKAEIMHGGGPVTHDGIYKLKMGEHVLTEKEAANARKHALMASGMKSLMKSGKPKLPKPKAAMSTAQPVSGGLTTTEKPEAAIS